MASKVSVDIDMFEDSTFVLGPRRSDESDGLPMYLGGADLCFSRENSLSQAFVLDREPSGTFSRSRSFKEGFDFCPMSRQDSTSLIDNVDKVVLGQDNSTDLALSRENSGFLGFLARETSANLAGLLCGTSSDISDLVGFEHQEHQAPSAPRRRDILDLDDSLDLDRTSLTSAASAKRSRGAPSKSLRGAHVKNRPDMQQTARDGAAHWAACVRTVRATWGERAARRPDFVERFGGQEAAAHGRIKAKQECLLRFLQLAADDGIVAPAEFGAGGFFGWSRFIVVAGRGGAFRRGLEGLFPAGFREDTLKEAFRRAGLLPEQFQWEEGWRGGVAFEYRERECGGK